MILDATYFEEYPTKLPQSEALGNGVSSEVSTADAAFITENLPIYEQTFFRRVLGRDLGDEFLADYKEAVDNPPLADKWQDMLDQILDTDTKKSPIANYVFFNMVPQLLENISRVGGVAGKKDEMEVIGVTLHQTNAWNLMADDLLTFYEYMEDNKSTYEHDDVYLDADYLMLQPVNRYGI